MFNHRAFITEWLVTPDLTDASRYSIAIEPADNLAPGDLYWRVIGVHHLTPEENTGKHNLFLQTLTREGAVFGGVVAWGWEGQGPNENSPNIVLDKPASEPGGNIAIYWPQNIWAEVASVHKSDRVLNVHTRHLDEGPGNTLGHHSFYVAWQLTQYGEGPGTEPEPEPGEVDRLPGFMVELRAFLEKWE